MLFSYLSSFFYFLRKLSECRTRLCAVFATFSISNSIWCSYSCAFFIFSLRSKKSFPLCGIRHYFCLFVEFLHFDSVFHSFFELRFFSLSLSLLISSHRIRLVWYSSRRKIRSKMFMDLRVTAKRTVQCCCSWNCDGFAQHNNNSFFLFLALSCASMPVDVLFRVNGFFVFISF